MKKILIIISVFLVIIGVSSCGNYEKTELTKDNFYDYFKRDERDFFDSNERIDDFTFAESDAEDSALSAYFYIPEDVYKDKFFNNVKIELEIRLYYGKTSVTKDDTPTTTVKFTSALHYTQYDDRVTYDIGCYLNYDKLDYVEKNGNFITNNNGFITTNRGHFKIEVLTDDYEPTGYGYSNFYREIVITSVTGSVASGGLTFLNSYHCS